MKFRIKHRGTFYNANNFLKRMSDFDYFAILDKHAMQGVRDLSNATPLDTGLTADSWNYQISIDQVQTHIYFTNSNSTGSSPVAILLQYGHATKNGGWVEGIDYINPVLIPIFDKIAEEIWKEVTK
jgi:hypothetical protein